jgi:hypothetical protein
MFNIAIPIIPIGFIADTFYIYRFCSDRFHTDRFHTDMFCLCTVWLDVSAAVWLTRYNAAVYNAVLNLQCGWLYR